jgi:uncharacterized membrane protein
MKVLGYVLTRVVVGMLFVLPVAITVLILREVLRFVVKLLGPIANQLPEWLTGPAGGYLAAALVLALVLFVAGMFADTKIGGSITRALERLVLGKVPGFTLIKSLAQGSIGRAGADDVKVVLVTLDDAWLFGFLIERHADGMLTVFVPSAPTPTSGSLYFFREDQVRHTDLTVGAAMRTIARLGVRSAALFDGRLARLIEDGAKEPRREAVPSGGGTASPRG